MKILHTSDWHIGRNLYGRKRYEEFEAFLNWLSDLIKNENVDVLLVAGDIFDNTTPSNRAQELYYKLLNRVAASECRHIVIIGGNHDSPSFLNAPKEVLSFLNVHVVGAAIENPAHEVLVLKDNDQKEELIVLAVPYLRDRDIRSVEAGESVKDKENKLIAGINSHYKQVCEIAEQKNNELNNKVPVIAMGHLFTAGGKLVEGDGVRDLYIGSLARIRADIFSAIIDYVALGHLHVAQKVAGLDNIRYSGSPVPMGFGEALHTKKVLIIEFLDTDPLKPFVKEVVVPKFRNLAQIKGDLNQIREKLEILKAEESSIWIEIIYNGNEAPGNLRNIIDENIEESRIEVLRIKNDRISAKIIGKQDAESALGVQGLDDMDKFEVFKKCMEVNDIPDNQQKDLMDAFSEVVKGMQEKP
ncbi:MAG: exonuclease SbcCD subunit D C-terminal domain-containing protein [Desulfobacterales bacterium]|nr:exonuclease SbcCD subunit D C-terminal domain-containing protein [Desulfobacterales bacterium]